MSDALARAKERQRHAERERNETEETLIRVREKAERDSTAAERRIRGLEARVEALESEGTGKRGQQMSLRPTEIALEKSGAQGLFVAIDDPDTVGVLLVPCSFEHRRVVSRADLENDFELHPARCATPTQPPSPQAEVADACMGAPQAEAQDCERCKGAGDGRIGVFGDFIPWDDHHPKGCCRAHTCPDCNGTGKQSPAEPQGDVVEKLADALELRERLIDAHFLEKLRVAVEQNAHRPIPSQRDELANLIEARLDRKDPDA